MSKKKKRKIKPKKKEEISITTKITLLVSIMNLISALVGILSKFIK